jgi:hypothetical protein
MRRLLQSALIALGLAATAGCSHDKNVIPTEVQGYWTTSAPGYKDRYLELDDKYVLIGVNEDDLPELQRASRVESHVEGLEKVYTIHSSSASQVDYKLILRYSPANGGEVRIQHKEGVVWKRTPL